MPNAIPVLMAVLLAGSGIPARAGGKMPKEQRVEHALNRLTFGPRPGDPAAVNAMGLKQWIDRQLHPERIPESPKLLELLQPLDSLRMSAVELVRNFPPPQLVRQMVAGGIPFPDDPDRRLMIRKLVERYERWQAQANAGASRPDEAAALLTPVEMRALRGGTPAARLAAFEALPAEKQYDLIAAVPGQVRQAIYQAASPALRRRIELAAGPPQVVAADLASAKLLRAIYSTHQLEEVLADFWFNHFNVFLDKGADRYLVTAYERDAIRPRVLGKFRDLLEATAKSPAMLFYLDNWQSAGEGARTARARRGLNENYGRELLELHTLGVDGGYTQKDVTETARCFTGWTIDRPNFGGGFVFNPKLHDAGAKVVLGVAIPAGGGMEDGERVLDILARHPSTARFVSRKLAQRFVADDPPRALVERMARTFLKSNGDIREVMKTMLGSREFWLAAAYRSKVKSPLELVASAARALDAQVDAAQPLVARVAQLGEPLYRKLDPNGYPNASAAWVNSGALLARINFAADLAANRLPGTRVALPTAVDPGTPEFQRR